VLDVTAVYSVCVIQVRVGNAEYRCSCVRYISDLWLIIGLSVGLGIFLIIVVIVIILVVRACRRRRRNKPAPPPPREVRRDGDNTASAEGCFELYDEVEDEDKYYSHLDDCAAEPQSSPATPNEYSRPLPGPPEPSQGKEYSVLGAPEPPDNPATADSPYYLSLKNDYER